MRYDNRNFCDLCERESGTLWPVGQMDVCPDCTKMIMNKSKRILFVIREQSKQIRGFEKNVRDAMLKNPMFAEVLKLDKELSEGMGKKYKDKGRKRSLMEFLTTITNQMKKDVIVDDGARSIEIDFSDDEE